MPRFSLLIIGERKSGKTSLLKSLIGDLIDDIDESKDKMYELIKSDEGIYVPVLRGYPDENISDSILILDHNKLPCKNVLRLINKCVVITTKNKISKKIKKDIKTIEKYNPECDIILVKNKVDVFGISKDMINISVKYDIGVSSLMDKLTSKKIPASV